VVASDGGWRERSRSVLQMEGSDHKWRKLEVIAGVRSDRRWKDDVVRSCDRRWKERSPAIALLHPRLLASNCNLFPSPRIAPLYQQIGYNLFSSPTISSLHSTIARFHDCAPPPTITLLHLQSVPFTSGCDRPQEAPLHLRVRL
jgi:hypothetical protein